MGTEHDDEEAALAAAFNAEDIEIAPAEAPAEAAAAPAPQEAPAADTPTEAPPDPFATLPPEFKALFEGVQSDLAATKARLEATTTELDATKRLAGQVPHLRSKVEKITAPPAPQPAPPEKPRLDSVEKLRADMPEFAEAIDDVLKHVSDKAKPATAPEPAPAPESIDEAAEAAEVERARERLERVRPTWIKDKDSASYQGWVAKQPAEYQQELRNTRDPVVFLDSLTKWDAFVASQATRAAPAPTRAARVAAAVTPQGTGGAPVRKPVVDEEEAAMAAAFKG